MRAPICMAVPPILTHGGNGAYLWIFINWALGLRACGHRVLWLEDSRGSAADLGEEERRRATENLRDRLQPFGLEDSFALANFESAETAASDAIPFQDCVLLNFVYQAPACFVSRFKRSVLMDIDPGLLQTWIHRGEIEVAEHDVAFTIGETVGTSHARFSDCGIEWLFTPPPIFLDAWPVSPTSPEMRAPDSAPYTTVTGWWDEWMELDGQLFSNEKRTAFLEFLDLPRQGVPSLELALILDEYTLSTDVPLLQDHGWAIREARQVCETPESFRRYIQESRGSFTRGRPSSARLATTWVDDRTLCYLASGKPVIVESTAQSRWDFGGGGLLRFGTLEEARCALEAVEADYEGHCRMAREIAEQHFDAATVARNLLNRVLV